jgi:ApbE superfamily uncharacterized protein (UPF0280 family)
MPRPPRIDFADAVYRVTSRGNGRADLFLSDDDRQRLVGQLAHHLQLTVSRHFGIDPGVLSSHGHHAGPAKAVAVAVASRLAEASARQIGLHYGIGSSAVRAIHRRLAERPDALKVVESLVQQLRRESKVQSVNLTRALSLVEGPRRGCVGKRPSRPDRAATPCEAGRPR